jgi:hypothetical protein
MNFIEIFISRQYIIPYTDFNQEFGSGSELRSAITGLTTAPNR